MLNSFKRWVQDVAVDLNPPLPPSASSSSPSSPALLPRSSRQEAAHHYFHFATSPNDRLAIDSSPSTMGLSRPISMDSVRSSKSINTPMPPPPPPPTSPGELDLSHLNREEQEHIANVLRRARAVDEQQAPVPPVVVHSVQSPPASIVPASLSPSVSSSSTSTSTSSFDSAKQESYEPAGENDHIDDNQIRHEDEELGVSSSLDSTLASIHRCQVCNKEQHQQLKERTLICLQCQADAEVARATQSNTSRHTSIRKSSSPVQIEWNEPEEDKIYDNVMRIDQELIERNSPIEECASHRVPHYANKMNDDNQGQKEEEAEEEEEEAAATTDEEDEGKQRCQSPKLESSLPVKIRSNNLTEIDENDFFYQEPSPYVAAIDNHPMLDRNEEPSIPSYKIDEYIDEDETDERDHVKELEETIANLSRHFPVSSPTPPLNDMETKPAIANLHQPSSLSVDNIDIDSILEMEIESPTTDAHYIPSSLSSWASSISAQHPLSIAITVPISSIDRRMSLSRSSGVRENLTDLLVPATMTLTTTSTSSESEQPTKRPLQRTLSTYGKHMMPIQRQKRNLPSVPSLTSHLQLRRANSESRFSLPAVPPSILITSSNLDDESDLLEIDLNDPTGSLDRTARPTIDSTLPEPLRKDHQLRTLSTASQLSSMNEIPLAKQPVKQLRDQTTNTPPMSGLTSSMKSKKKLKKKGSSSPSNTNGHPTSSTHFNGHGSPAQRNSSAVLPPLSPVAIHRPKLQKSTSTEMLYPFPVSKLLLSHDNLNPSRREGTDLGLRITGGHSVPNCMEVTACIEQIDTRHKNYDILKNAVQEGDEVLEVGGVCLRGKSALFVQNLMNSIEDEFEIVVRSKHVIPPLSPPIEIHRPAKTSVSNRSATSPPVLHNSLMVDSNIQRRHSMSISPPPSNHSTNSTVVKSRSTIMSSQLDELNSGSEQLLAPKSAPKHRVSSKERLFSVESLHRLSTAKSNEQLAKAATRPSDATPTDGTLSHSLEVGRKHSIKSDEKEVTPLVKQTSLTITTPENKTVSEESIGLNQPLQPRRIYEHRNSLLPNDPGLNGSSSSHSIDRRNSNESDESDNLSQYFLSPSSRKNSLIPINENNNADLARGHHADGSTSANNDTATDASRRLQNFIRTSEDNRQPRGSLGDTSTVFQKTDARKSSTPGWGSFKFAKKKTDSVDSSSHFSEMRENDYVGDIELQIGHDSEREQLVVRVIQAKNLPAKDTNGYSDPFVKIYLLPGRDQENKRRTKHIAKNLNPVWDHTVLYGNMHREELQYKMLEFTLWDYDRFKSNDFIGQVTIHLKDAKVIDDKPHWYRLQALRSREETSNRGSSPRLVKMTSTDSGASSSSGVNKNTVNVQSRGSQRK